MNFNNLRQNFREKLGLSSEATTNETTNSQNSQDGNEVDTKEEKEAEQNEKGLLKVLLQSIRRYRERGLVGNIDIYYQIGTFTSSISCDIEEESEEDVQQEEEDQSTAEQKEKLQLLERMAVSGIKRALHMLEVRAKSYKKLKIAKNVTLSNGVTVTDPIFGSMSMSVTVSATVLSLFNAIAYRAHNKELGHA